MDLKKMTKNNRQGGFIKTIVIIVVILIVMKYSGLTISQVFNWFTSFFSDVLK